MIEINNLFQEGDYEYPDIKCFHCDGIHVVLDSITMNGDTHAVHNISAVFQCNICNNTSRYNVKLNIIDRIITKKILQITKASSHAENDPY